MEKLSKWDGRLLVKFSLQQGCRSELSEHWEDTNGLMRVEWRSMWTPKYSRLPRGVAAAFPCFYKSNRLALFSVAWSSSRETVERCNSNKLQDTIITAPSLDSIKLDLAHEGLRFTFTSHRRLRNWWTWRKQQRPTTTKICSSPPCVSCVRNANEDESWKVHSNQWVGLMKLSTLPSKWLMT